MEDREIKLSVKNLKISFRTDGGKVQAVRDINFDLYRGETLAVVGESGSGKSVTSRAILGILANNAIKAGGEILYDGQDLMKISEEQFCKIRGDRIAMIFQDPLSSLNPIMRIGKQMTEAMIINGKINQKNCRRDFNSTLALLNKCMDKAQGEDNVEIRAKNKQNCKDFNKFECKHLELENAFIAAKDSAIEALSNIDDVLFHIEKNVTQGLDREIKEIIKLALKSSHKYVVCSRYDELLVEISNLKLIMKVAPVDAVKNFVLPIFNRNAKIVDKTDYAEVAKSLEKIKDILAEAVAYPEPNFFSLGYHLTFSNEPLPDLPVTELNEYLANTSDDTFTREFNAAIKDAIKYSNEQATERKRAAVAVLDKYIELFNDKLDKKQTREAVKELVGAVNGAIDRLETIKDNVAYTFESSINAAVKSYFDGIARNIKEEKRYARQKASYDKKIAAGKDITWKVADKDLVDLETVRGDIRVLIERVRSHFVSDIEKSGSLDLDARVDGLVEYLKEKASGVAHKITHGIAKTRALKLMEEVGIPEPRKRYRQYPFEFSGGMRQRIVIAIALSADPDILICDEPTTALDVTIQSQILELINKVKAERNLSVIFITHDLGVVANMADRVAVMYAGKIVEIGTAEDIFYAPAHPYTWALLSSMPDLDTKEKLEAIPGTPPNMIYPPKGDAFAERNKYAMQIDFEQQPPMFKISDTHYAATWLLHPNAPKIDLPKAVSDRIERMRAKRSGSADTEQAAAVDASASNAADSVEHNEPEAVETAQAETATEKGGDKKPSAKGAKKKSSSEATASEPKAPASKKKAASASAAAKPTAAKSTAKAAPKAATTAKSSTSKKTTAATAKNTAAKKSTEKKTDGGNE